MPAWKSAKLQSRFDEKVTELENKGGEGDPEKGGAATVERTQ